MDCELLRKLMDKRGFTQEMLASEIGIDRSTLSRKLAGVGKKGFGIAEIHGIVRTLGMSRRDILDVFFAEFQV